MTRDDFETLLDTLTDELSVELQADSTHHKPRDFEERARQLLQTLGGGNGLDVDLSPHPHVFPDIVAGEFGIEVKVTDKDSWRSVANSVFESTRSPSVKHIYVLFGKMGGTPSVKWGRYEDCVMHVRTSHMPRFEVEMYPEESLFEKMGITYKDFQKEPLEGKMRYIREYARGRLKPGQRLWWLEDTPEQEHSLPLEARLYMSLSQDEKRSLRAEAALLCPQIVKPSRSKHKYDDIALYLLTYHGVLCSQVRDLFSAGSVALRADDTRGGNYILRALKDIEDEMIAAAETIEDALFVEYWGKSVSPEDRIKEWLVRADEYASGWRPSDELFLDQDKNSI